MYKMCNKIVILKILKFKTVLMLVDPRITTPHTYMPMSSHSNCGNLFPFLYANNIQTILPVSCLLPCTNPLFISVNRKM